MREIEAMLQRDRQGGLPESPDLRYTAAAVRRRLAGNSGRDAHHRGLGRVRATDWPVVVAGTGTLLGAAGLALLLGLPVAWLWVIPVIGLSLCPILLRKGV